MIYIKLYGGLGNQMFQYAFAYALSLKWGGSLYLETSSFKENCEKRDSFTPRTFELEVFDLQGKEISREYLEKYYNRKNSRFWSRLPWFKPTTLVKENEFGYYPDFFSIKPPLLLDGYFQCENYFLDYSSQIKKIFAFPITLLNFKQLSIFKSLSANPNAVSIHVRRGDYVTDSSIKSFHGICGTDYYRNAIEKIKSVLPDAEYYLFTDSLELVKEEFREFANIKYIVSESNQPSWIDMMLMSTCKHHIIANSSYSWWGAWLGVNPNKTVIAPEKWFANNEVDYSNVVPEKWIKL